MTANQAISKIRVLLGADVAEAVKVELAADVLVDGTNIEVEGELEAGKPLFVVTEEGNIAAPAGVHQTVSNKLVTVGDDGVIVSVEEVSEEASEEEVEEEVELAEVDVEVKEKELSDEEKEKMEEEVEVEMEEKEEEMIVKIVEAMKPYFEEIKELKEKVVEMEGNFNKFSKEPAAKPIKKAEAFTANKMSAIERIAKIRKSK